MLDGDIPYMARVRSSSEVPGHPGVVSRRPDGSVTRILCKGCGEEIARTVKGELVRLTLYEEFLIKFNDESQHGTHCCLDCLERLKRVTLEQRRRMLEIWYCIDMVDWIHSIETTGKGAISKRDSIRVPVEMGEINAS